jgi:hypothetical protein
VLAAGGGAILMLGDATKSETPESGDTASAPLGPPPSPVAPQAPVSGSTKLETMEVARAVMVTVELDFGGKTPSIVDALTEIDRRYQPSDGSGRTFAILDAYGEPTPDGKLHMSMHVSSEKPGIGSLVFRRTGQVLWESRITPSSEPRNWNRGLTISIDNGKGGGQMIDGSNNPVSILDARVRDLGVPVRDFWPDGAEREVTFVYSACGCPVKVMARRAGERTVRTKELPVIFPDDPGAVSTISRLMGW